MELNFSKINGSNVHLDYDTLEASIRSKLQSTCKEAEIIVLNKFPVAVSAQATIDFIVLLKIPDVHNSWYRIKGDDGWMYVKNQIIAVTIIDEFEDNPITIDGNTLEVQDAYYNYQEDAMKLKWGLTNYLAEKCGLVRKYITIHPLIWMKNKHLNIEFENILIGNEFTYEAIERVIKKNYYFKYAGYKEWQTSELIFEQHIRLIYEQASKDSQEGYVTKKKIDRIQRKFGKIQDKANTLIGELLVEVKGKAGTGKTSELLKWMLQNSLQKNKGVFLTYNHLLVNDIALQINSFSQRLGDSVKKASTTTYTIHGYFYNVAKKLGVLLLMTEQRINELTSILDERWVKIEEFLNKERAKNNTSFAKLIMLIQNDNSIEEGVKREAILFFKFMDHIKFLPDQNTTSKHFKSFRDNKVERLANLESSNVFLKDYVEVLRRIRQATSDLDGFLNDMDVASKYDLLQIALDLKPKILDKDKSGKIDFDKLRTRYKKSISGFRANRIAYIDEAQDCHPFERDIFYNLFGSNNCVIANGDKEQLIRYSQLCDWHISQNQKIDVHVFNKTSKSYRMKPAIAALANHIAKSFNIDLNIEPLDTEDHGQIFISTSNDIRDQLEVIDKLHKIGERQGCTSYEALLLLKPADTGNLSKVESTSNASVRVNEFNNIIDDASNFRNDWTLVKEAQKKILDAYFWDSTGNVDKRELSVPGSLSIRSIYYASCRGVEAWSVMCFGLDLFFEKKRSEDEADNYLLNELFDELSTESRKNMYAATWVLMAITRCMENCYIQLTDPQSSIYKCIRDFAQENGQYITRV